MIFFLEVYQRFSVPSLNNANDLSQLREHQTC